MTESKEESGSAIGGEGVRQVDDWEHRLQRMGEEAEASFWGYLGCRLISAERDGSRVVIELDVLPHHLNGIGIIHGGVLSSLLDNAMGLAVMLARPDDKVVTTNLNVHFVSSLRGGKLSVTADIVHQSRRMVTATGMVHGEEGQLSAMGTGTFRVL